MSRQHRRLAVVSSLRGGGAIWRLSVGGAAVLRTAAAIHHDVAMKTRGAAGAADAPPK